MKPKKFTPAHKSSNLAELVCSNSLKSDSIDKAAGILKSEMIKLKSLVLEAAYKNKVFITREGSKGATAYFEDEIYSAESFDVKPVDTVGAGDAFNTGFIHSMLNLNHLESALRFGNAVAGYKLQGEGARYLPNLSQLEDFIK